MDEKALDDWIVQSVRAAGKGGGAGVEGIVEWGDALNHAIFEYEELRDGLARLVAAGRVHAKGGRWFAGGGTGTAPTLGRADYDAAVTAYRRRMDAFVEGLRKRGRRKP